MQAAGSSLLSIADVRGPMLHWTSLYTSWCTLDIAGISLIAMGMHFSGF